MSIRIANHAITVVRDGKRYELKAGEGFDLTKEEIKQFNELNPDAFRVPASQTVVVVGPSENTVIEEGEKPVVEETTTEEPTEEEKADASTKSSRGAKASKGSKAIDSDSDNL